MLVLGLLLHCHHKNPHVSSFDLQGFVKFGTALLLSPTAPIPSLSPSMLQTPSKDIVTLQDVNNNWTAISASCQEGVSLPDYWVDLRSTPEEWWKDLPVDHVTIIGGGDELYRDDILQFSNSFKVSYSEPYQRQALNS